MPATKQNVMWKLWRIESVWVPGNGVKGSWEACGRRAVTDTSLPLNPSLPDVRERLVELRVLRQGSNVRIETDEEQLSLYVSDAMSHEPLLELERYSL